MLFDDDLNDQKSDPRDIGIETPPFESPKQPEIERVGVDTIPDEERDPLTPTS